MLSRYTMNQNSLATTLGQSHQQWLCVILKARWIFLARHEIQHKIQKWANCNCKTLVFLQEDSSQIYLWNANTCVQGALEFSTESANRSSGYFVTCTVSRCTQTASLLINLSLFQSSLKMQKCTSKNFPIVTSGFTCHQGKIRARNSACLLITASIPSYWSSTQQGNMS